MRINNLYILCFVFVASILSSCNSDDKIVDNGLEAEAFLIVDSNIGLRNQEINFSLIDANEIDQSAAATFYINDEPIETTSFSADTEGTYTLYATYTLNGNLITTPPQEIAIIIPRRKILLEAFTGVWCGFCPRKTTAVKDLRRLTQHVAVVSIHGNSIYTGIDPLTIPEGMFLKDHYEVPGYPTGVMDRGDFWDFADGSAATEPFIEYAGNEVPMTIAINSNLLGSDLSVETTLLSEVTLSGYKIVVYLTEDGILLDQVNYYNTNPDSPFYQLGDPIVDFEHSDVLREILTDPLGDEISTLAALNPMKYTYTTSISSEMNPQNLKLVVVVLDSNGAAVNAQFASILENKIFE